MKKKGRFGVISKENKENGCKLTLSKSTSTPKKIMEKKIITKFPGSYLQSNNQHEDWKYKSGQTHLIAFFHGLTELID